MSKFSKNKTGISSQPKVDVHELQSLFLQAPLPMALLIGPDYVFAMANPAYTNLVGRPVVGKPMREAFAGTDFGYNFPLLEKVLQTGESVHLKEAVLQLPNGEGIFEDRFIDMAYQPYRDPQGVQIGIITTMHDVTEQVEARRKAEVSEQRYRSL